MGGGQPDSKVDLGSTVRIHSRPSAPDFDFTPRERPPGSGTACDRCGVVNPADSRFCSECGAPLGPGAAPPAQPPAPAGGPGPAGGARPRPGAGAGYRGAGGGHRGARPGGGAGDLCALPRQQLATHELLPVLWRATGRSAGPGARRHPSASNIGPTLQHEPGSAHGASSGHLPRRRLAGAGASPAYPAAERSPVRWAGRYHGSLRAGIAARRPGAAGGDSPGRDTRAVTTRWSNPRPTSGATRAPSCCPTIPTSRLVMPAFSSVTGAFSFGIWTR